jgi:hypothetical protein
MATVRFPDGTRIRASSIADRRVDDPERKFGLYLDATWEPTWPATVIAWEDFGLPTNPELAAQQIVEAFGRARGGELVEVGCLGGSGRTGTVLACMTASPGCRRRRPLPGSVLTIARKPWRPPTRRRGCDGLPIGWTPGSA